MKTGQLNHTEAYRFILGGKSFFTFLNPATGNRFTYKVVKHKTDDIYFVHVLTSPEIYTFIGTYKNFGFRYSQKSNLSVNAQSVVVFDYVINRLSEDTLNSSVEIFHDGRCGRCGRQLTTPDSVQNGFGPECMKMI